MKKDLHCPTCGRSMQQRSNKILNTFRPMAIQNHRPSIPSIGTSVKKIWMKINDGKREG